VKQIIEHQLNKGAQISFVFIQDGVIGTSCKNIISSSMKGLLELPISFYTLIPDLEARGIDINELQNNVKGIGYEDLVDILAITSKIVSWM
jgi:sulfur relay protein TusB/DsrH